MLFALSLQLFIYIDKIPHKPSLLQTEQLLLCQVFFTGEVLQSLNCICGSWFNSLQYVDDSVVLIPELDMVLQVWPYLLNPLLTLHLMQPKTP